MRLRALLTLLLLVLLLLLPLLIDTKKMKFKARWQRRARFVSFRFGYYGEGGHWKLRWRRSCCCCCCCCCF